MPQLLDVAIGTIFVFLLFSLVVSALNEYILTMSDQRAKFLRLGLAKMFGVNIVKTWRGKFLSGGLAGGDNLSLGTQGDKLLSHGLINAFSRADKDDHAGTPSYIPAGAFVTGLLDVIAKPGAGARGAADHVKLLSDFITEIKNARPAADTSFDAVIAKFKKVYGTLGTPPDAGSEIGKINIRVAAAADKRQIQGQLLSAASVPAAQQIIAQSATLQAELTPLAAAANGDIAVFKNSINQWFKAETELAALQAEAAVGIASYLFTAAQQASGTIYAGIENLPDGKLKESLQSLFQTVEGDVGKFKLAVEGWFNGVMDRVSGWYKRFAQKWMIAIGFILAALFNVDTLEIVRVLSNNPNLAKAVANQATVNWEQNKDNGPPSAEELDTKREQQLQALELATTDLKAKDQALKDADTALKAAAGDAKKAAAATLADAQKAQIASQEAFNKAFINADAQAKFKAAVTRLSETGIPMGWTPEVLKKLGVERSQEGVLTVPMRFQARVLLGMIAGWLITAIAASLGAPFWFDLLGRFVNVRASGKVPGEKETTSSPTRPQPASIDITPGTRAPAH
ncbi:hypothetical protein [Prosthecobacter sp.]|uniref:hypothetical protein n=1 Tax=Prosthecobacter sp. TaxID=1965333 RepID=UPI002487F24C|nr:hypothetical protein [Prosthecobacter sp.]MDI1313930.1 hypothetical protein [Prosthecobacter sp.]MDI1313933.1 hypothetical protein [Prosthecobacter sp.]